MLKYNAYLNNICDTHTCIYVILHNFIYIKQRFCKRISSKLYITNIKFVFHVLMRPNRLILYYHFVSLSSYAQLHWHSPIISRSTGSTYYKRETLPMTAKSLTLSLR